MDLAGSRALVIGGAGFVGSHLVEQLLAGPVQEVVVLDNFVRGSRRNLERAAEDQRLRVIEGSIADPSLLDRAMDGIDHVFHLAALWLHECVHRPRAAVEINTLGTFNVIDAAHRAGVRKLVFSSSASVYGDALAIPMVEDHPFNNRTLYGATKIAGEQMLRAFHEQHGLDYVGLRYMNIYGPRMDDKGAYVSVIVKVLDRIDRGERPRIFGDGSQSYDFVHVADVARANLLALASDATDDFYNVGTGTRTTINELVGMLLDLTGSSLEPELVPQETMFVSHRVGSIEKAERELGFRWTVPLEEGLRGLVEWRRASRSAAAGSRATKAPVHADDPGA